MVTRNQKRAPQLMRGVESGPVGWRSSISARLPPGGGQHGLRAAGMQRSGPPIHLQCSFQPQDRPSLGLVFRLVVGARAFVPRLAAPDESQAGITGEQLADQFAVVEEVGGEVEPAASPQQAEDEVDRLRLEEATLVVAALGP